MGDVSQINAGEPIRAHFGRVYHPQAFGAGAALGSSVRCWQISNLAGEMQNRRFTAPAKTRRMPLRLPP